MSGKRSSSPKKPSTAATTAPSTSASTSKPTSVPKKAGFIAEQSNLVQTVWKSYQDTTPNLLKIIDSYLVFVMLTGIILFVYVFIAGTFPYNSFLSAFIASVGTFVLAANLRIQLNPSNDFKGLSPEAAYAEFAFCSFLLYGFVVNFLG
ncbi:DAD family-domain-containing protein [Chytridium lagenaria]|nr:DAD family-domain-containing protein [Chytridium lagenaria]